MIYIFDLDYTLLDTKKFKKGLAKSLGISFLNYSKSYKKWFKNYGKDHNSKKPAYNIPFHIKKLIKDDLIKKEDNKVVLAEVQLFLKEINIYLKPGVEKMLNLISERKHEMVLMTYGNKAFNKQKISNLKINKYFKKIIYIDGDKSKELGFLRNKNKDVIIVNDNARESIEMKSKIEKSRILLVKGPYSENIVSKIKPRTISEITRYIKNEIT